MENVSVWDDLNQLNVDGLSSNNQTCENTTSEDWIIFRTTLKNLRTVILVSYLMTMSVGLAGNSLVIYIITKNRQIRNKSVANYYILNMAFADLFFVMAMPLFCYATYVDDWPFGTPMCKMSRVFVETNKYASMFTLVALSFDRFLASFYNMSHLRTMQSGTIVCCIIWTLCASISIPYWIYSKVIGRRCTTEFTSSFMAFWTFFELVMALIFPFIIICASYIMLGIRLQIVLNATSARSASVQKPSRKMLRTVLVVVVIFLVCQVPWHAQNIINLNRHIKYHHNPCPPTIPEMKLSVYLSVISTILGFVSSCCNPIIYGILNDNYRKLYKDAFCCLCFKSVISDSAITSFRRSSMNPSSQSVFRFATASYSYCYKHRHSAESVNTHRLPVVSPQHSPCNQADTEHLELEECSDDKTCKSKLQH